MGADFVYDILPSGEGSSVVVEATVSLLPTNDGGRNSPIVGKLRPNHNFGDTDNRNMFIGQIELTEGERLYPGEEKNVVIKFLDAGDLRERLSVGTRWRLQEGNRLIGFARANRILKS
jgi:translation elongation factor EF-Tu-like GTPase